MITAKVVSESNVFAERKQCRALETDESVTQPKHMILGGGGKCCRLMIAEMRETFLKEATTTQPFASVVCVF